MKRERENKKSIKSTRYSSLKFVLIAGRIQNALGFHFTFFSSFSSFPLTSQLLIIILLHSLKRFIILFIYCVFSRFFLL